MIFKLAMCSAYPEALACVNPDALTNRQ